MPRQSRTDKLLATKEAALETEVRRVAAEAERLGGELRLLRELRKQLAVPARSRAKARALAVPAAANTEAKATAA